MDQLCDYFFECLLVLAAVHLPTSAAHLWLILTYTHASTCCTHTHAHSLSLSLSRLHLSSFLVLNHFLHSLIDTKCINTESGSERGPLHDTTQGSYSQPSFIPFLPFLSHSPSIPPSLLFTPPHHEGERS